MMPPFISKLFHYRTSKVRKREDAIIETQLNQSQSFDDRFLGLIETIMNEEKPEPVVKVVTFFYDYLDCVSFLIISTSLCGV